MTEKNSKAIGDVCIFTEEESNAIAKEVLSARDKWIKRGPSLSRYFHVFYSLGAASSTDAANSLEEYQRLACRTNPWFDQHLPWVYNTIEKKLSDEIGSCKVERDLAYPGFHIFHIPRVLRFLPTSLIEKMTKMPVDKIAPVVHYDLQHRFLSGHWRKYGRFDFNRTLSFTIPVLIPDSGTGMNLFKLDRVKSQEGKSPLFKSGGSELNYRLSDESISTDSIKSLNMTEDSEKLSVEYRKGFCLYHTGKILHQANITRENMKPGEHRITIQGHGVMCDGAWRLYF